MNRLVPEPRVNKNGVTVIKHVRGASPAKGTESRLSSLLPMLNPVSRAKTNARRAELLEVIRKELQTEKEAHWEERKQSIKRAQGIPHIPAHYKRLAMALGKEDQVLERQIEALREYSPDTLEMLIEAFGGSGKLDSFSSLAPKEEHAFRTAIRFRECGIPYRFSALITDHVQNSTGYHDISDLYAGTEDHALVAAVFRVAVKAHKARSEANIARLYKQKYSARRMETDSWDQEERERVMMTPELAAVIMDHPDRTDDIISYMADREVNPDEVDTGHLRAYLDNASPSLSSGVL